MNPLLNHRVLEEELWRTIKLERDEEDLQAKSPEVFAYCTSSLLSLFHRVAYIWFLAVSVLELLNEDRDFRMTIPFFALLVLVVVLKSRQEIKRCMKEEETSKYKVWNGDKLEDKQCEELHTGDIIVLETGDYFPADVLVLASGRTDQTALVDSFPYYGKPKLRVKSAISETQRIIRATTFLDAIARMNRLRGIVRVTQPIADIAFFRGQIKLSGYVTASSLYLEHLCLKGCRLCHTPWIIGLVAYAGDECKCEMNRSSTRREKWPRLESLLNTFVMYYVAAVIGVTAISAGVQNAVARKGDGYWGLFRVFLVLYSQAVPASLYVLLDLARITFILFFSAELNSDPSHLWPHNYRLTESLGQVEFVLTGKNGTLTENVIQLKTVRVGNTDYNRCDLEEKLHKHLCLAGAVQKEDDRMMMQRSTPLEPQVRRNEEDEELCGFTELKALVTRSRASLHTHLCECMVLCNAVEVSLDQQFSSQSRIELALVSAVVDLGVIIHQKTDSFCSLTIGDLRRNYSVITVSNFKPALRRMRVLVQRQETQEGMLIVKGALDVMKPLLSLDPIESDMLHRRAIELYRKRMSLFVYARKSFSASEMVAITEKLAYLQEIDSKARKRESLLRELEKESVYLGMAGLKDQILPETVAGVEELGDNKVRVWVLSGDRESSTLAAATEIGLVHPAQTVASLSGLDHESTCNLELIEAVRTFVLKESLTPDISQGENDSIDRRLHSLKHTQSIASRRRASEDHALQRREVIRAGKPVMLDVPMSDIDPNFVLSIDGMSFRTALCTVESRKCLAALLFTAKTVLFHSMLPHQKALAVRFVRENFSHRPVTLAIGDEVNDISMIQEADIGVAIRRKGNKEVRKVSDFEVSSFAALVSLLLRYGTTANAKIGKLIELWVYASAIPVDLCVIYAYFNEFSGTSVVEPIYWIVFVLITGIFVLVVCMMDSATVNLSVTDNASEPSSKEDSVSLRSLLINLALALAHSCLIFAFLYFSLSSVATASGFTSAYDFWSASFFFVITVCVIVHFLVTAESLSVLLVSVAVILIGTLIFTIYTLGVETGDEVVLTMLFGRPLSVLGEFGAVLSTFVVSYAVRGFQMKTEIEQGEYLGNRETSVPDVSQRIRLPSNSKMTLEKVYRNTPQWKKLHAHSNYKMHRKWLHFSSPIVETEYFREMMLVGFKKLPGVLFCASLVVYLIYSSVVVTFLLGKVLLYAFTIASICSAPFLRWNLEMITTLQFLAVSFKYAVEMTYQYTDILSFLLPVEFALYAGMNWRHNASLQSWNLFTVFYTVIAFGEEVATSAATLVVVSILVVSLSLFNYWNEKETREEFKLLKTTKLAVDRAKDVLHCLFPSFVLKQVWKRQLPIALDQNLVTVLFCDICDFDWICSELNSQELMDLLDDLFKKIDDMCETYGLTKIETVGKTYLACAGLKERENELIPSLKFKNHARRSCEMAFEIMTLFKEYTIASKPLQANIGINSGPVIAGVVGSEKPQFALIGDTVNTASRMSSTAPAPCSIQISADTYALLGQNQTGISVIPRKVEVKGKGEMEVFVIQELEEKVARPRTHSVVDHTARRPKNVDTLNLAKGEIFGNWRFSTMMDREAYEAAIAARSITIMQREREEDKAFRRGAVHRQWNRLVWGFAGVVAAAAAEFGLWIAKYFLSSDNELWPQVAALIVCLLLIAPFPWISRLRLFPWILLVVGILHSAAVTYSSQFFTSAHSDHTVLIQVMLGVYFLAYGGMFVSHSVVFVVLLGVYWVGLFGVEAERLRRIETALAIGPAIVLCLFFAIKRQHNVRVYTSFELRVSEQMRKTNDLIGKIMPPHVYESLLNEKHKVDVLANVTLVFADIVGFTALSSRKSPTEMVHLLNELFSGFDLSAARNKVFKVHTIGDCYVAMGYTGHAGGRDRVVECLNILAQAFDMIHVIDTINQERPGLNLGMRIGIHTGRVIAGITGAKIVRYDIYGPDVLIANKMESNGSAGRIHVSDVTKDMLEVTNPSEYTFEFNKEVEIKSISATYRGYFISKTTSFPS